MGPLRRDRRIGQDPRLSQSLPTPGNYVSYECLEGTAETSHGMEEDEAMISREIHSTIFPKTEELIGNDDNIEKSHQEICTMLLQSMYMSYFFCLIQDPLPILSSHYEYGISQEESNENSKPHSPMWEFNFTTTCSPCIVSSIGEFIP